MGHDDVTPSSAPLTERAAERRQYSAPGLPPRRLRSDRGSTSLTVALLTPVMVVLMFAGVQAALWGHARTEARSVARRTAALVARAEVTAADAAAAARVNLADDDLVSVRVDISRVGPDVVVTITGRAPGIIRGTGRDVSVTEAVPFEAVVSR